MVVLVWACSVQLTAPHPMTYRGEFVQSEGLSPEVVIGVMVVVVIVAHLTHQMTMSHLKRMTMTIVFLV